MVVLQSKKIHIVNQKLFVGNLNYSTSEDELRDLFSQAGSVSSASVITDKFSGRSKGFGFVEMSTPEEAEKAVEMFNGQDLGGRKLTVNEAQPMQPRAPRKDFGQRGGDRGGYGRNHF